MRIPKPELMRENLSGDFRNVRRAERPLASK